jgi:hypothetical protein
MVLIEGVGDEVVVCFGMMLALLILILAWISTNVSDSHLISVIVVDMRNFQRLLQRIGNITQRPLTGAAANNATEQSGNGEDAAESEARDADDATVPPPEPDQSSPLLNDIEAELLDSAAAPNPDNPEDSGVDPNDDAGIDPASDDYIPPSSDDQLRQRRVAFFNKIHGDAKSENPSESTCPDTNTNPPREGSTEENVEESQEESPRLEGHIRIRLKYLDDRKRLVQAKPEDTIAEFKSRHFAAEIAQNTIVRLICNGQELKDSHTMNFYSITDNSVIHCLLTPVAQNAQPPIVVRAAEFDVGTLMFPLFGLILLLIWYCRFTYRNYFNAMSTFSLIGITFLFIVALLASWRTQEVHDE